MDRRLLPLAASAFAIGTDAFVIAGLLPEVGADLDITTAAAGQLITVFSLTYALAAPVIGTLTSSFDRRKVILFGLAVFVAGNVVTAVADSFALALVARVVTGLGAATASPQGTAIAAAIAPPERRGRYLAVVTGGLTVASVLGVPLGTLIGAADWRLTLWTVAGLGVLAAIGIAVWLPPTSAPAISLAARLAPLRDRTALGILATTALVLAAGYTFNTYVGAILEEATGGSEALLTVVLFASGVGALVGNLLAGRLVDRLGPERLLLAAQIATTVLLVATPLAVHSLAVAIPFSAVFGAVGWMMIVPQQHRLVTRFPEAVSVLIGLNASALYGGVALGGFIGGAALNWVPVTGLGLVGAVISLAGIVVTAAMIRAPKPVPSPAAV
ncbi:MULTISPECIES: MFS transporter [Glycomyces]|uniref:MFS family arabinose efflux permease n=2 Tax=Glycomyces TaxID=58113 RepID=A0A9X3PGY7_9ACTN|nr:MFS transporter [Glycomyces lechevalierae]MDA1385135.1 MFS transporter [Glycomyces lechevalierae]MDR7337251.1 putative MFS family arabinose efflux permease [Glycomyces lechevalierae]